MKSAPVDNNDGYFHDKDGNNKTSERIASTNRAKRKREGKAKD